MKKVFQINLQENTEIIQPVLNIRAGDNHFSTAITDHASGQLKQVMYYLEEDGITVGSIRDILDHDITKDHSFYQVRIGYDYPGNSLVPAAGFRQENAGLMKTEGLPAAVTITEHIPEWQLYNVYTVPGDIHGLLTGRFPSAKYWHQVSVGLKAMNAAAATGSLLADIRHTDFTVIAARSGKLLLAQTYEYSSPEDIIYYLLRICSQFSLSQNEVQMEVSGLIDRESALFKDLYQYFVHLHFRDAGWKMSNSEYPSHFFTSLNDLAKCAS